MPSGGLSPAGGLGLSSSEPSLKVGTCGASMFCPLFIPNNHDIVSEFERLLEDFNKKNGVLFIFSRVAEAAYKHWQFSQK